MRAVAVGTGTAIANAKKGDGDILIVHSKLDELNFIEEGFGVERFDLMYNDFIIVGPKNDPANISNKKDIADVMKQLASSKYKFISRDDNSGTHKKELLLWKIAGLQVPKDNSYLKTGSSMAKRSRGKRIRAALVIAVEFIPEPAPQKVTQSGCSFLICSH